MMMILIGIMLLLVPLPEIIMKLNRLSLKSKVKGKYIINYYIIIISILILNRYKSEETYLKWLCRVLVMNGKA
jgi:hypothetical protein